MTFSGSCDLVQLLRHLLRRWLKFFVERRRGALAEERRVRTFGNTIIFSL
jgi:hypothetical protein